MDPITIALMAAAGGGLKAFGANQQRISQERQRGKDIDRNAALMRYSPWIDSSHLMVNPQQVNAPNPWVAGLEGAIAGGTSGALLGSSLGAHQAKSNYYNSMSAAPVQGVSAPAGSVFGGGETVGFQPMPTQMSENWRYGQSPWMMG